MTIKQQGGIFGRNPTFNDVSIEGEISSDLTVNADLDVSGGYAYFTASTSGVTPSNARGLALGWNNTGGGGDTNIIFNKGGGSTGGLVLSYNVGGSITDHCIFKENNDLQLYYGNLKVASGSGIDFSATSGTGTSELFDDYEEGTFTATLTGTTSAPTTPVTVTSHYTKIGRSVTVTVNFLNVSTVGASGNIRITGLPFTSALNAYTGPAVLGSAIPSNYPASQIGSGNTYLDLVSISSGGGIAMVATTGVYIFTTITYFV